jgi:Kef-type K+ transport system membrane component KefB
MSITQGAGTLFHLLLALAVIVAGVRLSGALFRRLGQPPVIGELVGGILLGPTLLGRIAPDLAAGLLPPSVHPLLNVLGSLGVVLYMFLIGLELDLQVLRRLGRSTMAIAQAGVVVPFALGVGLSWWLYDGYAPAGTSFAVFALFVGVSLSVTAFPVLARILSDRGMTQTPLGVMALSAAAMQDATAWCLLAVVVGIAQSEARSALATILLTGAFVVFVLVVVRPVARWVLEHFDRAAPSPATVLSVVLAALLASAAATEVIGVHAVFGAFLFGAVVPGHLRIAAELREKLEGIVSVLFLPVFFATIGMGIDLGALGGFSSWLVCGAILAAACVGKLGGTLAAARLAGLGWRASAALGALMNTRGLVELIVLDIGLGLGILSSELFTMLVITALVTTFMTSPLLEWLDV